MNSNSAQVATDCMHIYLHVHVLPGNDKIKIWQRLDICVHSFKVEICHYSKTHTVCCIACVYWPLIPSLSSPSSQLAVKHCPSLEIKTYSTQMKVNRNKYHSRSNIDYYKDFREFQKCTLTFLVHACSKKLRHSCLSST